MYFDQLNFDQLYSDQLNFDQLYFDQLYFDQLYFKILYIEILYFDNLYFLAIEFLSIVFRAIGSPTTNLNNPLSKVDLLILVWSWNDLNRFYVHMNTEYENMKILQTEKYENTCK